MHTRNRYEDTILKDIRSIPSPALPQIVKLMHVFRESFVTKKPRVRNRTRETGFCGTWKDRRPSEVIIKDIYAHRTGYAGRSIEL